MDLQFYRSVGVYDLGGEVEFAVVVFKQQGVEVLGLAQLKSRRWKRTRSYRCLDGKINLSETPLIKSRIILHIVRNHQAIL